MGSGGLGNLASDTTKVLGLGGDGVVVLLDPARIGYRGVANVGMEFFVDVPFSSPSCISIAPLRNLAHNTCLLLY